jgi:hypothetical protein
VLYTTPHGVRFQVVYRGADALIHNDGYDPASGTWFDQAVPNAIRATSDAAAVQFGSRFHIVYVGWDGWVHNDAFDPSSGAWFDQIAPNSVQPGM